MGKGWNSFCDFSFLFYYLMMYSSACLLDAEGEEADVIRIAKESRFVMNEFQSIQIAA